MQPVKAEPAADAVRPFRVRPADVPPEAVRFVRRTLLRNTSDAPADDELAAVIVAGLMTILPATATAPAPAVVAVPRPRRHTRATATDPHGMTALF